MSTLFVQFSDPTDETIIAYFAGPQDPKVYPNQGEVDVSDARWAAYFNEQPVAVQRLLPTP